MNEDKQKILNKLSKILILAEGTKGTPEGEAAMRRASSLMAKHRIAESEVDLSTDSLMQDEVECHEDKGGWRQWVVTLGSALAHTFDCKMHFHGRGNFKVVFVGTDSDVETCVYFQEVVMHHIEFQAMKMFPNVRFWKKRNEFGQAAVSVVQERLWEMKKAMTKEEEVIGSSCTDLVVVKNEMVEQVYKEAFPNLSSAKNRNVKSTSRAVWEAGRKAGATAPLNVGIEG